MAKNQVKRPAKQETITIKNDDGSVITMVVPKNKEEAKLIIEAQREFRAAKRAPPPSAAMRKKMQSGL